MARRDHVFLEVPQDSIAENPFHARATVNSLLADMNDMKSHTAWAEKHAAQRGHSPTTSATVARVLSAGIKGRRGQWEKKFARRAQQSCPGLTAEMTWIITNFDKEYEQTVYDLLAARTTEFHIGVWSERQINQAAAKVLEETRVQVAEKAAMQFVSNSQLSSMEG